jgi:hypothetical protein
VEHLQDACRRRIYCVAPIRRIPPGAGHRLDHAGDAQVRFGLVAAMVTTFVTLNLYLAMSTRFHWQARIGIVLGLAYGFLVAFVVGFLVLRWRRRRKILVCVTSDGVTGDQRPGDVFSLADAKLGLWGPGTLTAGTALHLHCGPQSFVVGGRDHRLATATRLDAPPVDCPDAWMSASDFDELLTMVGRRSRLDVGGPAAGEPTRCLLFPKEMQAVVSGAFGEKLPLCVRARLRLAQESQGFAAKNT